MGEIKVFLKILFKVKPDEIEKLIDAAGIKGERSTNFREGYHNFLVGSNPSKEDAIRYVNGEGEFEITSKNVKKHLSVYLKEFALAEAVREKVLADIESLVEVKPEEKKVETKPEKQKKAA